MVTRVTRKSKKLKTGLEETVENISATLQYIVPVTRKLTEPAAVWSSKGHASL